MRYIIIILIILIAGCASQKRCLVKFPPDTITRIESSYDIFFQDTLIEVRIPGDTVYVESAWNDEFVWIDEVSGHIPPDIVLKSHVEPIWAYVPLAYSKAWVDGHTLKMLLVQKDSVLQFKIDSAIRVNTDSIWIYETKIVDKIIESKFYKMYKAAAWFELVLILILCGLLILFFKLK